MGDSIGNAFNDALDFGRKTAGFFTGGTSGANIASGEAPTAQTLMTDASGLAAAPALAGAGLGGAAAAGDAGAFASEDAAIGQGYLNAAPELGSPTSGTGLWSGNFVLPSGLRGGSDILGPAFQGGGAASPSGGGGAPAGGAPRPMTAPVAPGGSSAPAAGGASAPTAVTGAGANAQGTDPIAGILKAMRENAGLIQLGLGGAGLAMAGSQKPIPNQQQLNELAQTGSQAAKDLITSYRSGHLSAAQQANLDQLTQGTKNQINQYFASIGQSDSTAHMQALAQVDQQALGMKQQMLDNMLQQGLSAIGVASGPLNSVANFQIAHDKNLTDAFGNFANAVGQAFGRQAGTTTSPSPTITGQTPSTGLAVRGGTTGETPSSARQ